MAGTLGEGEGTQARSAADDVGGDDRAADGGESSVLYARLNQLLRDHGFDDFAEAQCASFYAATMGRPGLPPGIYFRLLLIGYFEGLDSERGIAWRAADSLALRDFLGLGLEKAPPDHSTISRTRRLIDLETHRPSSRGSCRCWRRRILLKGKTIGIDATTLEANAALRSIVRRDTGETYQEFLTRLATGVGHRDADAGRTLARLDRKRKKKGSNDDWTHPHDPDARITKMKDGRTHLAHKAEHAVDMETGAIVGRDGARRRSRRYHDDRGDGDGGGRERSKPWPTATDGQTAVIDEVVADKGYHSNQVLVDLAALDLRTYIAEPDRGRRNWKNKAAARDAVYANRRRIRGARGLALLRRRSERLERPNAHLYDTGAMRRTHLRGHANILKRLLVHAGGFNLGLLMRTLVGVGTPRGLQGRLAAVLALVVTLWMHVTDLGEGDIHPAPMSGLCSRRIIISSGSHGRIRMWL